jgi:uncharacterized membrane protein YfcA
MIVVAIQSFLGALFLGFAALLGRGWIQTDKVKPSVFAYVIGAVTNFFDTLGIGNFAPTTAALRAWQLTSDDRIPGTLNAGHCLPGLAQAIIFIVLVEVDVSLLVMCMVAAIAGGIMGARLVSHMPIRAVRLTMGIALLVAATALSASNLGLMPKTEGATSLSGIVLAIAVSGHFLIGMLMAAGVGFFAPSLVLLSFLGLDTRAVFPIMMASSAALMPFTGAQYLRTGKLDLPIAIALSIGGLPAVLIAAFVVRELPLDALRWLVAVVVFITAITLIRAGLRSDPAQTEVRN